MGANFSEFFDDEEEEHLEEDDHKAKKEVNFDENPAPIVEKKVRSRSPPPQENSLIQTKATKTRKRRPKQQRAKTAAYRKW